LWYGSNYDPSKHDYKPNRNTDCVSSDQYSTYSHNKQDEEDVGSYVKMDDNKKENLLDEDYKNY